MKKLYMVGLVVCLLTLASGCSDEESDDVVCTDEARASVVVRVVDATGAPLPGAMVTYRVDRGPRQSAECSELPGTCTHFVAGFEVAGDFTIRAERAGFQPATASIRVERDVCHVRTQELLLTLVPA